MVALRKAVRTRFWDSYGGAGDDDAGAISRSRETSAPLWLSSEELPLGRKNETEYGDGGWKSHYTQSAVEMVRELYKADFEAYGYVRWDKI